MHHVQLQKTRSGTVTEGDQAYVIESFSVDAEGREHRKLEGVTEFEHMASKWVAKAEKAAAINGATVQYRVHTILVLA